MKKESSTLRRHRRNESLSDSELTTIVRRSRVTATSRKKKSIKKSDALVSAFGTRSLYDGWLSLNQKQEKRLSVAASQIIWRGGSMGGNMISPTVSTLKIHSYVPHDPIRILKKDFLWAGGTIYRLFYFLHNDTFLISGTTAF
ncbi:hypothetical protein RF11_15032 [Thelohanellus kitauei]|uniref:Uncharacterized protein n=1 Tax=Thelohanellus kitauei TaxID=669202 RepID=A0A0C2J3Y5_THEKT|nr:hypothetical protein RF11_15032 [Thelohanellus kitauei]